MRVLCAEDRWLTVTIEKNRTSVNLATKIATFYGRAISGREIALSVNSSSSEGMKS